MVRLFINSDNCLVFKTPSKAMEYALYNNIHQYCLLVETNCKQYMVFSPYFITGDEFYETEKEALHAIGSIL